MTEDADAIKALSLERKPFLNMKEILNLEIWRSYSDFLLGSNKHSNSFFLSRTHSQSCSLAPEGILRESKISQTPALEKEPYLRPTSLLAGVQRRRWPWSVYGRKWPGRREPGCRKGKELTGQEETEAGGHSDLLKYRHRMREDRQRMKYSKQAQKCSH